MLNDLSAMAKKLDSKASSLPKVTERIIKELEEHRLVYLTGKAGCLTYYNKVDVKVVRRVKPVIKSRELDVICNYLDSISGDYYVYLIYKGDGKTPVYIGKGRFKRVLDHLFEDSCYNRELFKFLSENEYVIAIDTVYPPEQERQAYLRESELIDFYEVKNLFNSCKGTPNRRAQNSFHNTNSILKLFKEIRGDYYDYSKFIYKGFREKSIIVCPIHGEFEQSTGNHMAGQNCPRCVGGVRKPLDHYLYLIDSYLIEHSEYIFLGKLKESTGYHSIMPFKCKICGKVHHKTFGAMAEGKGCNYCGTSSMKTPFDLKLSTILGKYPDIETYIKFRTGINARRRYNRTGKLTATCLSCGENFSRNSNKFLDGNKHSKHCTRLINKTFKDLL